MNTLQQHRKRIDLSLTNYKYACDSLRMDEKTLREVKDKEKATLEAQEILQGIAKEVQQAAHTQISSVVTRCLEAVFGDEAYQFKIDFKQARGKTEARLLFVRDGEEIEPIDSTGGGVIDVASFALRLSCLILSRPARRRVLIMDEPWKFLSRDYQPLMRDMMEVLSEELGVQFIIVTHSDLIKCGKVISLE